MPHVNTRNPLRQPGETGLEQCGAVWAAEEGRAGGWGAGGRHARGAGAGRRRSSSSWAEWEGGEEGGFSLPGAREVPQRLPGQDVLGGVARLLLAARWVPLRDMAAHCQELLQRRGEEIPGPVTADDEARFAVPIVRVVRGLGRGGAPAGRRAGRRSVGGCSWPLAAAGGRAGERAGGGERGRGA